VGIVIAKRSPGQLAAADQAYAEASAAVTRLVNKARKVRQDAEGWALFAVDDLIPEVFHLAYRGDDYIQDTDEDLYSYWSVAVATAAIMKLAKQ
jgi:hypothetical protein